MIIRFNSPHYTSNRNRNPGQPLFERYHYFQFNSESIQNTQARIEDLYSQLKDLASEKQSKLDENLKLFQCNREIEDLKSWIADREVIAGSEDIGQDFDNVQMLEERFDRFADETKSVGSERLSTVNAMCDQLVACGHQDAALINEWKEDLNEMWQSLLELLITRREVCYCSWFVCDLFVENVEHTLFLLMSI